MKKLISLLPGHHLVFFIREMCPLRKWIILHAPHSEPLPGLRKAVGLSCP